MSKIGDRLIIPLDPEDDFSDSETRSVVRALEDDEEGPDASWLLSIAEHVSINEANCAEFVASLPARNIRALPSGARLIRSPAASDIVSNIIFPPAYRSVGGDELASIDQLAAILHPVEGWRDVVAAVKADRHFRFYTDFENLSDGESEFVVESGLLLLVQMLKFVDPRLECGFSGKVHCGIRGLLAEEVYAVHGYTDSAWRRSDSSDLKFITEAKNELSFPSRLGEYPALWYKDSRAAQVLMALYFGGVPVLLYTQKQFKLFVETPDRTRVVAFPPGVQTMPMSDMIIDVIVLLILSTNVPFSRSTSPSIKTDGTLTKSTKRGQDSKSPVKEPPTKKARRRSGRYSSSDYQEVEEVEVFPLDRVMTFLTDEELADIERDEKDPYTSTAISTSADKEELAYDTKF